jgi:DNA-binding LytR/AlgR family response regulator
MGIFIYFLGFLMENPAIRWNLHTFFDSCKSAFLLGIIPFTFFTLSNYRHLVVEDITKDFEKENNTRPVMQDREEKIQIVSQLKKEELSFYPRELLYAESDGNYVVFYISGERGIHKRMIRNSISNIEKQLLMVPYFIRIHRAFIVNVRQICSKKGNSLGYRLKFYEMDSEVPVSRQNVRPFDELLNRYR